MDVSDTLILIDNGHGVNTAGKRSPDEKLIEGVYTRQIAQKVVSELRKLGYNAELLTPETYDVSLLERVHRVNVKCNSHGKDNVLCVSIHCNAAGNGSKWLNATGWEIWTSEGETESDVLAEHFIKMAKRHFEDQVIRELHKESGKGDKEKNFTILKSTLCPAVLTENFFMDSKKDVKYLLSEIGKSSIIRCHVDAIISYLSSIC